VRGEGYDEEYDDDGDDDDDVRETEGPLELLPQEYWRPKCVGALVYLCLGSYPVECIVALDFTTVSGALSYTSRHAFLLRLLSFVDASIIIRA